MRIAHEFIKENDEIQYAFFPQNRKEYYFMFDFIETLKKVGTVTDLGYDFDHGRFDLKFSNASTLMYQDEVYETFKSNVMNEMRNIF